VMSTVGGKWLEREMDVQYCWDNIRQPVLFGTAINKIVQELGAENVSFLEIAPHAVPKSCIDGISGKPVSLIRRPNPKVPTQNTRSNSSSLRVLVIVDDWIRPRRC